MMVLTLTNAPDSVRGYVSRFFYEVASGVYVGNSSTRVRDRLWQVVTAHLGEGRAVLVFADRTEQGFSFRTHNSAMNPTIFDGIVLPERLAVGAKHQETGIAPSRPPKKSPAEQAKLRAKVRRRIR